MKALGFAGRNAKEMLRDKLTLIFGIGFPVVLMLLLSLIQSNIPVALFEISHLSPGIIVFGFSFISLFSGLVIAKDRSGSFMLRLLTSPMKASDFILGYTLPLIPMFIAQSIICFIVAFALGLEINLNALLCLVVLVPAGIIFVSLGLICGCIFNDKQVGGICGALLTNISAWLSGTWFDLKLVGGIFEDIAMFLPFARAVEAGRAALSGNYSEIMSHLIWVIVWAVLVYILAVFVFTMKMRSDKK
ncbi:MAG: ABC transporter permease [Oscillospiraceae bacterium]|nr:ABC transporter permease [Oscillospiraceae bacterium]